MKICPVCKQTFGDDDMFCGDCGVKLVEAQVQQPQPVYQQPQPVYQQPQYYQPKPRPNYDHTAEFTKDDMKKNKVLAVFAYLFGIFGIIVAALIDKGSDYVGFHLKQKMKMILVSMFAIIAGGVVAGILAAVGILLDAAFFAVLGGIIMAAIIITAKVIDIIFIVKTLFGKSTEAPIYRVVKFL